MALVRGKDTRPELLVRRMLFARGYRYRLHRGDLPGTPDLAFPGRRKVVFVHGCFWHRHGGGCRLARLPKSRVEFWEEKLSGNRLRDERNQRALVALGWGVFVVWECELDDADAALERLVRFLEEP